MTAPQPSRPPLRDRLLALRDDLHHRLTESETIEPAWLGMLADIEVVLVALDRDGDPK